MAFKSHRLQEVLGEARHVSLYMSAKNAVSSGVEGIIGTANGGAGPAFLETLKGVFLGASMINPIALVGLAAISSVSAALAISDARERRDFLAQDYAEEIGAKLGKDPCHVTRADFELLAKGDPKRGIAPNQVFAEELRNENKSSVMNVIFAVATTLATVALMAAWVSPMTAGLVKGAGIMGGALKMLLGVVCYNAVKAPLHYVGSKLFGLDKETTMDRIKSLGEKVEQGESVSREQVLSIYVSANPQLGDMLKERYGARYDAMSPEQQASAANLLSRYVPLDEVTQALNQKRICATELAFTVQGDVSGVALDEWKAAPPQSLIESMIGKATALFSHHEKSTHEEHTHVSVSLPQHVQGQGLSR